MCFVMSIFFNFRNGRKWKGKGVRERLTNYRNRKSVAYPFPNTLQHAVGSLEDIPLKSQKAGERDACPELWKWIPRQAGPRGRGPTKV